MKAGLKRRRGRWRSGTAVETVVFIPALAVQLGASLWLWQAYDGKLAMMKEARGPVFTEAISGCVSGAPSSDDDAPPSALEGVDVSVVNRSFSFAPGRAVLDRPSSTSATRLVRVADGYAGGPSVRLSGAAAMPCNESAEDGDGPAMKRISTGHFDPRSP